MNLRSRYGFAAFWFLSLLAWWSALRLVLLVSFGPGGLDFAAVGRTLASGVHRDLFVGLWLSAPLLLWMAVLPERWWPARWHRILFFSTAFLFWFVEIFLGFAEYFFFEEFRSRFNTVAVDYVLYPKEVFINIWESYHVALVVAVCAGLSLAWLLPARSMFRPMWLDRYPAKTRWLRLIAVVGLGLLLIPTIHFKGARASADRTVNEIANNGALSFGVAAWTHHLDYGAFYKTDTLEAAYQRARRLLGGPGVTFVQEGQSIRRHVAGDASRPRLNVVLILEESLGSEFWGCLGRPRTLTPEMDRLAAEAGLLFTNFYACGNRTVRGMEGALASFPPLPGDSIVKRDLSDNVETIARVLKRDGYSTLFVYGGRGLFDGMRSFALRNGYDRFIEQKHFTQPLFTTIWGVCDEDLFARSIEECRALNEMGKPFFATLLSVSNHKPYTYPEGRIPEDPEPRKREKAVKYSDYALGQFFRAARKEAFWTNTIFAVVADHGARVYGSQDIPIRSYAIPLLIAGPAVVTAPARLGQLGCSLDIPPTLLGLIGRPYESLFFGRDLLHCRPAEGCVWLNHNRDVGLLRADALVVLGLMRAVEFYQGDPKMVEMKPAARPGETEAELEKDAIAVYQVADDLYVHRSYRIDAR